MWVEPQFWESTTVTSASDVYSAGLTALAVLFNIVPSQLAETKDDFRDEPSSLVADIMRRQAFAEWHDDVVHSLLEICMKLYLSVHACGSHV